LATPGRRFKGLRSTVAGVFQNNDASFQITETIEKKFDFFVEQLLTGLPSTCKTILNAEASQG
jgi:hypothetical protein